MTSYKTIKDVAVITIENPPVNALSLAVREGILDGLSRASKDDTVCAIVIIGGGRTFPAGADISEFANGKAFTKPLPQIIEKIESTQKPIVCAIHGTAFGGGLEVALGCHYRIASTRSKVGLPEVNLGILPGAGGTQRLPRLIGVWLAAEMICSGKPIEAVDADAKGILDDLVEISSLESVQTEYDKLLDAAITLALRVKNHSLEGKRVSQLKVEPVSDFFYEQLALQISKNARGMNAPLQALKAVKASAMFPFKEGMQREQQILGRLFVSSQAKALQHIFFAERQTMKIPGIDMKKGVPIKFVGVIGAGMMGSGIAINFIKKGIPVVLIDAEQEFLDRGVKAIEDYFKGRVKKGKTTRFLADRSLGYLRPSLHYEDLSNVDLVIEAVFENLDVKKSVLKHLDEICKPQTILCTNTSTLDIDQIASATNRPDRVIGTHFFSPANVMRLMENVAGSKTSERTIASVMQISKTISKIPVLVGNCFGFIGNRMLFPYNNQANALLQEGAFPHDVDKVLYDFGFPMGLFQMSDLAGNDIGLHIRKAQGIVDPSQRDPNERYVSTTADKLCEMKRFGVKSSKGWYSYAKGSRKGRPDKEVMDLIVENSKAEGFVRRNISAKEIEERCLYALINEGFKCLEEGMAYKPGDIDIIWIYGYGFPPQKGGPMHYADAVGLKKIYDSILQYGKADPKTSAWKPSKLLEQLASSGKKLAKYWTKKLKAQSNL
uniref:Peroxisomal bifunctional enzyme n=2 Tax=Hirondellea gigas TaxID=1518452 RepID=A0A6A7G8Y7_9CRUS